MNELPELPQYQSLLNYFEDQRKSLIKNNTYSEEEDFVRTLDEAKTILSTLEIIQTDLYNNFKEYPSLISLFDKEFTGLGIFFDREYIAEICFLGDYIFPDKELFEFVENDQFSITHLSDYQKYFADWVREKISLHLETQAIVKDANLENVKRGELTCQCVQCVADYRTKIREKVYKECVSFIDETKEILEGKLETDIWTTSNIFHDLRKKLDSRFRNIRNKVKRGSYNKLDIQIKGRLKGTFYYPSDLAVQYTDNLLKPFLVSLMREQGLNPELISDREYDRFFKQLSSNLWRNERYIEREFKKLIKSVLLLKRKDISANILKEYLGEFWLHSLARQINRKIIYHMGPTNSGKTYHAIQALAKAKKGCYLAPLRLLAGELYDTLNEMDVKTTLLTGEEIIETEDATHYSSTIEMARFQEDFDCVVIDEIQMITDSQRGWAWTRALVNIAASEVHICGDQSAYELVKQICDLCGDTLEVKNYERMTKLEVQPKPTIIGDLTHSDAVIVFSRRKALKYKYDLEKCGFKVSIVYGRLSPEVRREQARKFDAKETDIIVSTDAIAMGMNLPIKRIVFTTLSKFIDGNEYIINDSEIKQIAGRAGRYQRYPTGYVTCLSRVEEGIEKINKALGATLEQSEFCMVGPDLDIFAAVNKALRTNALPELKLSEFLRLFNTMLFKEPFQCVELKEMIEIAEMVEDADRKGNLSNSEIFGFSCAPVHLGMMEHIEFFVWILNHYANARSIHYEPIDADSNDIDYLETKIKCVELFQWLSRHFDNKYFEYDEFELLDNKGRAISKLNDLLSEKIIITCSSCGAPLAENSKFAICENCFKNRRFARRRGPSKPNSRNNKSGDKKHFKKKAGGDRKKTTKKSSSKSGRNRSQKSTKRFD